MDKCLNCSTDLIHVAGRRKKIFCSGNCRVKYSRNKNKTITVTIPKDEYERLLSIMDAATNLEVGRNNSRELKSELAKIANKEDVQPKSLNQPKLPNSDILKQIAAIEAEKIPKERDTALGRRPWYNDQQKRISELKNKLQ